MRSTYIIMFTDNTLQLKVGPLPELLKIRLFTSRRRGTIPTELCMIPRVRAHLLLSTITLHCLYFIQTAGEFGDISLLQKKLQCLLIDKVMIIKITSGL